MRKSGWKHTDETKLKLSKLLSGRVFPHMLKKNRKHTEESKTNMKEGQKLRWLKPEEKEKVSGKNSKFWKGGGLWSEIWRKENISRQKPKNCEICNSDKKIILDHNHNTGKFRGWIKYLKENK